MPFDNTSQVFLIFDYLNHVPVVYELSAKDNSKLFPTLPLMSFFSLFVLAVPCTLHLHSSFAYKVGELRSRNCWFWRKIRTMKWNNKLYVIHYCVKEGVLLTQIPLRHSRNRVDVGLTRRSLLRSTAASPSRTALWSCLRKSRSATRSNLDFLFVFN